MHIVNTVHSMTCTIDFIQGKLYSDKDYVEERHRHRYEVHVYKQVGVRQIVLLIYLFVNNNRLIPSLSVALKRKECGLWAMMWMVREWRSWNSLVT